MTEYIKKIGMVVGLITIVLLIVSLSFTPFTVLNYVGPMAGVATAFVLLWGVRSSLLVLSVIVLATFICSIVFDFTFDAYFGLISLLAIALQAFWCQHLTSAELLDECWLSRRAELMSFILKIGPVSALVSASAVSLISLLDNEMVHSGLIFIFFSHWALTLLTSVFVTSLLLFSHSQSDISRAKKAQVIIASLLGVVALCLLFTVTQKDVQRQRNTDFTAVEQSLLKSTEKRIEMVDDQLKQMAAFFNASNSVDSQEFDVFGQFIFRKDSGVKLLAWIPTVSTDKVDDFNADIQRLFGFEHYQVRAMDAKHLTGERTQYHSPIRYVFPSVLSEHLLGIDLLAHPENKKAMLKAASMGQSVATVPLHSDLPQLDNTNIYIFYPLYSNVRHNPYLIPSDEQNITGYLLAVVDVFEMFTPNMSMNDVHQKVTLYIEDNSSSNSLALYGEQSVTKNRLTRISELNAFSRNIRVQIQEKEPWLTQQQSWVSWSVLVGSVLGGILYQYLILLMTAYSTELKQRITFKTRELILAKEASEKVSRAKSQFLNMLSSELNVPIKGIAGYTAQLKAQHLGDEQKSIADDIEGASAHLGQFVQVIKDMSEIETGSLTFQRKSFDFHEFIKRMESMSNVSSNSLLKKVTFIINSEVPKHIDGDELRLQQIFTALMTNGSLIFNSDMLRVTVKSHMHKHSSTTIFLVVTPHEDRQENSISDETLQEEFNHLNTSMTLAQEICHQLGGSIKLLPTSDNYMITASFQADISEKDAFHFDSETLDKYQEV